MAKKSTLELITQWLTVIVIAFNCLKIGAAQYKRDPVIGISEIYYTQCIRDIRYQFKLELINQTLGMNEAIPEYTITINGIYYMSRNIKFREFVNGFVGEWLSAMSTKNTELAAYKVGETARPLTPYKGYDVFLDFNYEDRNGERVTVLKFNNMEDPTRWDSIIDPSTGGTISVIPKMTFKLLNDDCKEVLNGFKRQKEYDILDGVEVSGVDDIVNEVIRERVLRLYPAWDRNMVYVTSSISSMTDGGFLGYSRSEPLHRLKYYRLDNNTQKFWIELYSARDDKVKTILPKDGKDYLAIEGVIYFDASTALK